MKQLVLLICLFFNTGMIQANNILVSNVSIINQNATNNTWQVKFDIAWDNSWRTSTNESNWDAAWIFIKYRPSYSTEWKHAYLSATGHVSPSGATTEIRNGDLYNGTVVNGTGAIMYRSSDGIGNVSFTNAQLRWNYGAALADNDKVEIAVYAIEMVYVPQGAFSIGDASISSIGHLRQAGTQDLSFVVSSESAVTLGGNSSANLIYDGPNDNNTYDFTTSITKVLPADYPKGYQGFYCMKYECSMGQYVDFLNSLTPLKAEAHFANESTFGYTIIKNGNVYTTTTPERACNFVSPLDAFCYADWSGLRPMSELEYEKAARGDLAPVAGEFAGGVTTFQNLPGPGDLSFAGATNEQFGLLQTGGKAVLFATFQRPLRCGILAGSPSILHTRASTGGSYYGIMDLSSNLGEICIGITEDQRYLTKGSGDGSFDVTPLSNWNGLGDVDVKGATNTYLQSVSDRLYVKFLGETSRVNFVGFRCVIN